MSLYMNWFWTITVIISGSSPTKSQWSLTNYIFSSITIKHMPLPAGPLIIAGAQLLGQGAQAGFTSAGNRKQRKWMEKQYERQRADALADWNMQNEYNSPASEMARLRAAGLNTHLMYKNGTHEAGPIRSTDMGEYRPNVPQVDVGSAISAGISYYDTQIKEAQADNLKAQKDVILMDAALRASQVKATDASTEKTAYETSLAKELKEISLETAAQQLKKLTADTDYTLDNNERQKALSASTLQKAGEEILNLRAQRASSDTQRRQIEQQIINLRKDGVLKDLEIKLKKVGMSWQDPAWMRFLQQNIGLEPKKIVEKAQEFMRTGATGGKMYQREPGQGNLKVRPSFIP